MNKLILTTFLVLFGVIAIVSPSYAQQTSFDLKKASNQYTASGTVSISRNGSQYTYSAVVKDLPSTLPANGVYYILWGLNSQGKADNLGPITNSAENRGNLNGRITQFFITSEKERLPEYVSGPRIVQTDTIPESAFAGLSSATPKPSSTALASATPIGSVIPVGGPAGAPETGLGGAVLFNGIIYSLGSIGFTGLGLSVYNRLKKKYS